MWKSSLFICLMEVIKITTAEKDVVEWFLQLKKYRKSEPEKEEPKQKEKEKVDLSEMEEFCEIVILHDNPSIFKIYSIAGLFILESVLQIPLMTGHNF